MDRRKTQDVLWLAFLYAKQDRITFMAAYGNDMSEEAVQEAMKDLKAFDRLQEKLFGTTKTELDAKLAGMGDVDLMSTGGIARLKKYMETTYV